ncbi:biotin/lipoyl-binding protein, partial [Mycobacterium tuberculosis]|nr:biotin/lipoyl-binding protein [Mycobacterium tuberculosis]
QPSDHTVVQSTVNAQVQQVLADVGKTVEKGEPLVRLDISDSKNQLAQAQADVAAAQAQAIVANKLAERNKILLEQGFVSQIEYERSVADSIAQREA